MTTTAAIPTPLPAAIQNDSEKNAIANSAGGSSATIQALLQAHAKLRQRDGGGPGGARPASLREVNVAAQGHCRTDLRTDQDRQGKHLLLRGMEKVAREWEPFAGCQNLLKLHTHRTSRAN